MVLMTRISDLFENLGLKIHKWKRKPPSLKKGRMNITLALSKLKKMQIWNWEKKRQGFLRGYNIPIFWLVYISLWSKDNLWLILIESLFKSRQIVIKRDKENALNLLYFSWCSGQDLLFWSCLFFRFFGNCEVLKTVLNKYLTCLISGKVCWTLKPLHIMSILSVYIIISMKELNLL